MNTASTSATPTLARRRKQEKKSNDKEDLKYRMTLNLILCAAGISIAYNLRSLDSLTTTPSFSHHF